MQQKQTNTASKLLTSPAPLGCYPSKKPAVLCSDAALVRRLVTDVVRRLVVDVVRRLVTDVVRRLALVVVEEGRPASVVSRRLDAVSVPFSVSLHQHVSADFHS